MYGCFSHPLPVSLKDGSLEANLTIRLIFNLVTCSCGAIHPWQGELAKTNGVDHVADRGPQGSTDLSQSPFSIMHRQRLAVKGGILGLHLVSLPTSSVATVDSKACTATFNVSNVSAYMFKVQWDVSLYPYRSIPSFPTAYKTMNQ